MVFTVLPIPFSAILRDTGNTAHSPILRMVLILVELVSRLENLAGSTDKTFHTDMVPYNLPKGVI